MRRAREGTRGAHEHSRDIRWHPSRLDRDERWDALGQQGATVWLTGLPASGKSTIAAALEQRAGRTAASPTCSTATTSATGCRATSASTSPRGSRTSGASPTSPGCSPTPAPCRSSRSCPRWPRRATHARRLHDEAGLPFLEVFVDTPVEECARRDPKGLYARAREGRLSTLTGSGAPYEAPESPDVTIRTLEEDVAAAVARLRDVLPG